jgi:hypothetical protein
MKRTEYIRRDIEFLELRIMRLIDSFVKKHGKCNIDISVINRSLSSPNSVPFNLSPEVKIKVIINDN